MNKFEDYCASVLTSQMTLLQKVNAIIKFLKDNPTYNVYFANVDYSEDIQVYNLSDVDTRTYELKTGDAILFKNAFVGFVESAGSSTFTILNATNIRGLKGDKGDPQDVYSLFEMLSGTSEIIVDINEENNKIEFHLDNDVSNKINNSLQLPREIPATEKIVGIGTNGAQKLIDASSIGGGSKLYQHDIVYLRIFSTSDTPITFLNINNEREHIISMYDRAYEKTAFSPRRSGDNTWSYDIYDNGFQTLTAPSGDDNVTEI